MPSKLRMERICDRIRQEVATMLLMEVSDPRVAGVSVTDVKVDRELTFADIFVSAVEGQERAKEVLEGLNSASGYIRRELSHRVELRTFPRLRFHWDPTPEKADHIEKLLATLRSENPPADEPTNDEDTDETA